MAHLRTKLDPNSRLGALCGLGKWNGHERPLEKLDLDTWDFVREHFYSDVLRSEKQIGRDLGDWLEHRAEERFA